jgi:hypothetical protein
MTQGIANPAASRRILFAMAAAVAVLLPNVAYCQETEDDARRKALLEGTHLFRRMLHDLKFKPLENFQELQANPSKSILVVLGETSALTRLPGGLKNFVRRGGALLLATDRSLPKGTNLPRQLKDVAGVIINANTVVCTNPDLSKKYKGFHFCPILQPIKGAEPDLFRLSFNNQELQVATNVPAHLLQEAELPGSVRPLALLPELCFYPNRNLEPTNYPIDNRLFMVGGELGKGKVLVLADHSVFINEMMLPKDNNNVEFTNNCLLWLRGEEGSRDRVLFLEDGVAQTKFDIPLKSLKIPPADLLKLLFARRNAVTAGAQEALAQLENRTDLSGAALDWLDELGFRRHKQVAFVLLGTSALFFLYTGFRITAKGRSRRDGGIPPLNKAGAWSHREGGLLDQRTNAQIRSGNFWESAQQLVRDRLPSLVESPTLPTFLGTRGGFLARWKMRRRLRRLQELAWGHRPFRISQRQFHRLKGEIEKLKPILDARSKGTVP